MKTPEELAEEYRNNPYFGGDIFQMRYEGFLKGYDAGVASSHEEIKALEKRCHDLQKQLDEANSAIYYNK